MPSALVISPIIPAAMEGRSLGDPGLDVELAADAESALSSGRNWDLLVLADMSVDEQQAVATKLHSRNQWRLVPILYLQGEDSPGLAIPGSYRPELDGIVRGALHSAGVRRRMRALARDGVGEAQVVSAGRYELDPIRANLRVPDGEVSLTEREAEIIAILLRHPNRTVMAGEIIEKGWGREPNVRYLQILRRHVSNIRRKLEATPANRSLRTVRGSGYLFDIGA